MSRIYWNNAFATGINIIDQQHQRIIHYINELDAAGKSASPQQLREILLNLMDYTLSHFTFEEALMDEAGFPAAHLHSQTHDRFREKIYEYQQRLENQEDIQLELSKMLNTWLIAHIADDDTSYVPYIKENMPGLNENHHHNWISQKINEIFH